MKLISFSTFFGVCVFFRLLTVLISARNERKLKQMGAVEYGAVNSTLLIIFHFLFYFSCIAEGCFYNNGPILSGLISKGGLVLYGFAIVMLYYVIFEIRHVWTIKLLIAPKPYHKINQRFIFRVFKHPNYFLNIIPELIGFGLIFSAKFSLLMLLPLYLFILVNRIAEEKAVMKHHFADY